VNKDPEAKKTLDLSVIGDEVKEYRIHTVNGASCDSYNDIDKTEVGITDSQWMPFTGSIVLDPHSVNVIEVR